MLPYKSEELNDMGTSICRLDRRWTGTAGEVSARFSSLNMGAFITTLPRTNPLQCDLLLFVERYLNHKNQILIRSSEPA